jgi:hypothetical protein
LKPTREEIFDDLEIRVVWADVLNGWMITLVSFGQSDTIAILKRTLDNTHYEEAYISDRLVEAFDSLCTAIYASW